MISFDKLIMISFDKFNQTLKNITPSSKLILRNLNRTGDKGNF